MFFRGRHSTAPQPVEASLTRSAYEDFFEDDAAEPHDPWPWWVGLVWVGLVVFVIFAAWGAMRALVLLRAALS